MLKVLDMARKRRKFTKECKAEVVKLVKEGGKREVRELRREKELLGKAAAFFASQKQHGTRS